MRALDELWRKRIVREQGPNAYDFTHDKLRDVAYGETSAPQRRLLHRRVAEALVAAHEEDLDPVSARIAAHCESAGLVEQAIPHYSRAAIVAQGVYAHDEAIALVGRGLVAASRAARERAARRLGARAPARARAELSRDEGVGGPRAGRGARPRARPLRPRGNGRAARAGPLRDAVVLHRRGPAREVRADHGRDGARLARDPGLGAAALGVRHARGGPAPDGPLPGGLRRHRRPRAGGRPEPAPAPPGIAGPELRGPRLGLAIARALVPRSSGHGPRARASHALRLARQLGQPFSQAIAATYLALLQQLRADPATFRRQAEEALELATEFKATYYRAWAAILVAYAETLGRPEATALARLRERHRELQGDGGAAPPAVLPRAAGRRPPPGRRSGGRPRRRGRGLVPQLGRRTSAGGTRSSIACARSCCWPAAPRRPRRKRPSGARSRSRADSRRSRWSCAPPGLWLACGRDRVGPRRPRPAGARLFVVHGRPRDPRPSGSPGLAFRPSLNAGSTPNRPGPPPIAKFSRRGRP